MTGMPETHASSDGGRPDLSRLFVVLDFDGTITQTDCNEVVLRRHTGTAWYVFEQAARRREISHAECLRRQIRLLHIPRRQVLREFAAAAVLRPGFAGFLRWLVAGGGRAAVISVGFREGIEEVWRREALPPVELFASELRGGPGERFEVVLHPAYGACSTCGPGACKAGVLEARRLPDDVVVVFGDGISDLCPARRADVVFARAQLAQLCQEEGISWHPLDTFSDAHAALAALAFDGRFAGRAGERQRR